MMMRGTLALFSFTLFAVASCSQGDTRQSAAQGGGDIPVSNGRVPICKATCNAAADCASSGNPLEDEHHYACNAGRCAWRGCQSDTECASAAPPSGPKFVCRIPPGSDTPTCIPGCQAALDCAKSNNIGALGDASHFDCVAGACQWKGCRNTQECAAAFQSSKVVCEQTPEAPTLTCVPTCTTPADCAIPGAPLSDKGHYACKNNRCEWQGCRSTQECKAALQSNRVICE